MNPNHPQRLLNNTGPRLSRVVWNTNGWQSPSGPVGKSRNAGNHEQRYNFGYEEWSLDTEKVIDGYKYGFLEPMNQHFAAYTNQIFPDIYLYTIHGPTGRRYWAAHLRNVEVLTQAECDWATNEYNQRGWLDEMKRQIHIAANQDDFTEYHNGRIVHLRFKPKESIIFPKPILIKPNHPIYRPHGFDRFQLFKATDMELPQ
ncbi:MAG: hypothetical protein JWP57_4554 [Spirosoma sp.]|nr:hypothetical protein [Spirosoma sp.]